jgi:polyphosphate kinase
MKKEKTHKDIEKQQKTKKGRTDLGNSRYYFNRELSFIEFNKRVLAESEYEGHPLLERLKFVSIFSTNLDEFFMIRVAGLKRQIQAGVVELSRDGMTPEEQFVEIRKRLLKLYARQEEILLKELLPELEKNDIHFHEIKNLTKKEVEYLDSYFCETVLPVLTPLTLDPGHPFPRIINRALNIVFVLDDMQKKSAEKRIAFLQIPGFLPRFVPLPDRKGYHFVLIEQLIKWHARTLFPGLNIEAANPFRVTRDADFEIAEDEAEDLLKEIAEQIKNRIWGSAAVRLEVSANMPEFLVEILMNSLELQKEDVYILSRPLNLGDLMQLLKIEKRELKDKPFKTRIHSEFNGEGSEIFDALKKKELIVHHPFDSFTNSTLKLIKTAASDPDVLAIKITLYRTGTNSPVVDALKLAAENGKAVTAFVELKARFDEDANIIWAQELENAGCHVIYGVLGLKTHCKICVIVRREPDGLRSYLHLSSGNYNSITARIYTDLAFFTTNPDFAKDAIHLFNYLTGYSYHKEWNNLVVAPMGLRKKIVELIDREAELHTPENPGLIFVKLNSIAHGEVTQALYRASQKGVRIQLLVRGICCLVPGVKGVSENIEVRSIIGRFLEHSRVFYFKNTGKEEIYLSSADWMTRNLHKRVELMFPIFDKSLKKEMKKLLEIYWKDNTKSWRLKPDGTYELLQPSEGEEPFSAQQFFLDELMKFKKKKKNRILPKHITLKHIDK